MPGKTDIRNNDFDFYGDGLAGIAVKNSTTSFDFKITKDNCYCSGGEIIVQDAAHGDYIKIEIVDKDNILGYGAGAVLQTYLEKWYVDYNGKNVLDVPYAGYIYQNLYVRLKYTSVSTTTDPHIAVNYTFHIEKT
jgi:hypothetical protein